MYQDIIIWGAVIAFLAISIIITIKFWSDASAFDEDEHASNDPITPTATKKGYPV